MTTKGNNIMARGKSLVHIVTNKVNVPKVMVEVHYLQLKLNNKMDNAIDQQKKTTPKGTNSKCENNNSNKEQKVVNLNMKGNSSNQRQSHRTRIQNKTLTTKQ